MNFETSLQELYFNLETLNIVKSENNPYGDGKACERIVAALADHL